MSRLMPSYFSLSLSHVVSCPKCMVLLSSPVWQRCTTCSMWLYGTQRRISPFVIGVTELGCRRRTLPPAC